MGEQAGAVVPTKGWWNRWQTLAAAVFLMICAGPVFSFGAIALSVKEHLGATEREIQLVSVAGNVGLWTNVLGGLVFDKFGAQPTLLAGALLTAVGYWSMWLVLFHRCAPWLAAVAWFVVGHGSGWIYISTLFANLKNFAPQERGFVVGALSCFFGSSATVFVALLNGCLGGSVIDGVCHGGALGGNVLHYVGLLAVVVPSTVATASVATSVREGHRPAAGDRAGLRFGLMLATALSLVAFICCSNFYALTVNASVRSWANYVLLVFLALFLALPIGAAAVPEGPETVRTDEAVEKDATAAKADPGTPLVQAEEAPQPAPAPAEPLAVGPSEAAGTGRFWALVMTFGITVGADISTLNILASIVHARDIPPVVAQFCVIVVMCSDTYSRFLSGFSVGKGLSPTGLLICGPLLMSLGQGLLATSHSVGHLYAACVAVGLSDGIMWSLGPLLTGKAFGLRFAGRNFGFVVLGAAAFTLLLSFGLEPAVYQQHVKPGMTICTGHGCFGTTLRTAAAFGLVATASAIWLHCLMRSGAA